MIKTSSLRHPILSAVFGLFLFVSLIPYYNHSITNDYNIFLNYSYFLQPFSVIGTADASTMGTDNDDSSAQDTARRIGFSNVTNLTDNPNDSVYPQIAASENNVYAVWEDSTTPDLSNNNYDIYIKKSADWGESFAGNTNSSATDTTTEVLNLSNNPGFSNHPQIAAYDEKVHVAWIDDSLGNEEILLARSIDNGTTFSEVINLSNTTNTNSRNLELSSFENNVYAVWLDEDGQGEIITDLLYVKSSDQGNTFSPPVKLNNNGEKVGEAQLAAYNNAVYVVWGSSPYDHVTSNLFFTKSTDNGNTFSNATEVRNDNFASPSNVEIVVLGNNNSERNREQSLSSSPSSQQVQQEQPHLYIAGQVP